MIKIKLYNFNKKPNSTKIPSEYEGVTFNCAIKNVSSVISPVVDIAVSPTNIVNYNYAYIEEFDRYYFINDIVYDQGLWTLSLSCDLLATYKEDILDSNQYIIRSTNKYDPNIVDTMYLTTNILNFSKSASIKYAGIEDPDYPDPYGVRWRYIAGGGSITSGQVSDYFNASIATGSYVLGVIGNNATGVDYYVFTYAGLKEFIRQAFAIRPSDMSDVSSGVAQALYNPLQYITMCKWYPYVPSTTGDNLTSINVGPYRVPQTGSLSIGPRVLDINKVAEFYMDIEIPRHPDAADYSYLNLSPFSEYNLYFQPFGNIPIDSSKIAGNEELTVTWTIDFATGLSNLIIRQNVIQYIGDDSIIFNTTAEYGVDIPISSLVTDFKTGAIMSGLTWLKDRVEVANAAASGEQQTQNSVMKHTQYANAINAGIDIGKPMSVPAPINTSTIDKVIDALGSYKGQLHTVGSSGSFLAYVGVPFIYAYFFDQAEKDPDRYGRPYYQKNYLYAIRGYCLCSNAYINFTDKNPTASEYVEIINMLNNGIYIEV